ncbi:MAG: FHA domain-containing protein [Deltaproteobacteria bacterium]|nr:FHA domain-containing protein [Deltaproteobacteria bacterium]
MPTSANMKLRAIAGDLQGQRFSVRGELVLGRATTCTLFIPDRRVSREHARVYLSGDRLMVQDLASHNGTFVNEQKIDEMPLLPGDRLRLGSTVFLVEGPGNAENSASVRVISDIHPVEPRMVRQFEASAGPLNMAGLAAESLYTALGVGNTAEIPDILRKTKHFAILVEASRSLQNYSDLNETLPGLLDLVMQVLAADRMSLVLLDDQQVLIPKVVRQKPGPRGAATPVEPAEVVLSKTVADMVLQQRCAVITADAAADSRFVGSESVMISHVRSLAVVPVLVGNRLLGLIEAENRQSVNAFDESDLHMLSVLASMVGVALDHLAVSNAREQAIAELRTAQAQLLATQERLIAAERMGVLGRLASGIAHEVKNHLGPFMLADMIASKYPNDEAIQDAAQLMLEAQQRIFDLVDELREFAGGVRSHAVIEPCNLVAVVRGVVRFVSCDRSVNSHQIDVRVLTEPIVPMDAGRIRQVLINLIRNAAEASEANCAPIVVTVEGEDEVAVVSVQDSGTGIPAEVQERIFEPFFTTKGDRGLGLGLDLSRQIVRAHGGSLTFTTQAGEGTTFAMALPLAPQMHAGHGDFDDHMTDTTNRSIAGELP